MYVNRLVKINVMFIFLQFNHHLNLKIYCSSVLLLDCKLIKDLISFCVVLEYFTTVTLYSF